MSSGNTDAILGFKITKRGFKTVSIDFSAPRAERPRFLTQLIEALKNTKIPAASKRTIEMFFSWLSTILSQAMTKKNIDKGHAIIGLQGDMAGGDWNRMLARCPECDGLSDEHAFKQSWIRVPSSPMLARTDFWRRIFSIRRFCKISLATILLTRRTVSKSCPSRANAA